MKIYFHKNDFDRFYYSSDPKGGVWWDAFEITKEHENKIKSLLNEKFKSVKFETAFVFYFNDPADMAAFILWSYDGIEI